MYKKIILKPSFSLYLKKIKYLDFGGFWDKAIGKEFKVLKEVYEHSTLKGYRFEYTIHSTVGSYVTSSYCPVEHCTAGLSDKLNAILD